MIQAMKMIQAMTVWDHSGPARRLETQWTKGVHGVDSKTTALEKQKQHCEFLEENGLAGATQDRGLVSHWLSVTLGKPGSPHKEICNAKPGKQFSELGEKR